MRAAACGESLEEIRDRALAEAEEIASEDIRINQLLGKFGARLLRDGDNVLTHCNAGWLAFVDYGTALSPVYAAFNEGVPVHVWVDETRPSNQGAFLTT